jgi:hypothetical protein
MVATVKLSKWWLQLNQEEQEGIYWFWTHAMKLHKEWKRPAGCDKYNWRSKLSDLLPQ